MIQLSDILPVMRTMRRQLIKQRWPILALLLAQLLSQVAITAHASEHAFHDEGAYCDALEHADHQQGNGLDAAIPGPQPLAAFPFEPRPYTSTDSASVAIAYRPRAPPIS